ncbi:MAG: RNA polymerase sigma factor [Candidatus Hydrogenedentes bacterium]|nr:RNA polymerase sigma factor [Candidatus Hydrogenedentota bacterium]
MTYPVTVAWKEKPVMTAEPHDESDIRWPRNRVEFEALVNASKDKLVRHAFRRLGFFQEAEEVVQEVFTRMYANLDRPRAVTHVSAYLFRATTNACTDALRRRRFDSRPLELAVASEIADGSATASQRLAALEAWRETEKLIARLPRRHADVVRLRIFDELRFVEIAEVLGISLGTVKSRFRHGLEKLRRLLPAETERTHELP